MVSECIRTQSSSPPTSVRTLKPGKKRAILSKSKAPVFYVPGNHDDDANTVERYRSVFGKDYFEFKVKNATFIALDSQLLGNFDVFESHQIMPLSAMWQTESRKMLDWLGKHADDSQQRSARKHGGAALEAGFIFVVQHVPTSRNEGVPADAKPHWTVQEPYRSRELELLRRLGVKHLFAGHWHAGMAYQADGITYHLAPATSWSSFNCPLRFAIHTISPNGDVKTEFVNLK